MQQLWITSECQETFQHKVNQKPRPRKIRAKATEWVNYLYGFCLMDHIFGREL